MNRACDHEALTFASGGFYLMCMICGASWVARQRDSDRPDYSRGAEGFVTGADLRLRARST